MNDNEQLHALKSELVAIFGVSNPEGIAERFRGLEAQIAELNARLVAVDRELDEARGMLVQSQLDILTRDKAIEKMQGEIAELNTRLANYWEPNPLAAELEEANRKLGDANLEVEAQKSTTSSALSAMRDCQRREQGLREALTIITSMAQDWCDSVDRDSSWDGWDSDYKKMKWKILPLMQAPLAESPAQGPQDEREGRFKAALARLVNRLEIVHADEKYKSVWMIAQMHHCTYTGATYTDALEAARKELSVDADGYLKTLEGDAQKFVKLSTAQKLADALSYINQFANLQPHDHEKAKEALAVFDQEVGNQNEH